jgi:hypothetical protein
LLAGNVYETVTLERKGREGRKGLSWNLQSAT